MLDITRMAMNWRLDSLQVLGQPNVTGKKKDNEMIPHDTMLYSYINA